MNNGERPCVPVNCGEVTFLGLTKREYFAGLAMRGMLAGRTEYESPMTSVQDAVEMADALLAELEKTNE
jgi:hypothetical protein